MSFVIGLAQCGFPADGDVLGQVERFAQDAAERGIDLLVFPEDLMSPRSLSAEELRMIAEPIDGPFACALADTARTHNLWIVATMYEADPAGGAPYNVALVVDSGGAVRGAYRKCHLYDAHNVFESERTQPGGAPFAPIDTPFGRLGLGICYDLRFPEVARMAALAGAELLVFPSAWYDGSEKVAHWQALLRARAIENELYVAGICKAGERYVGRSLVCDPLGRVLVEAADNEAALLTCRIDVGQVAAARDAMPVLAHRRSGLYELVCAPRTA